MGNVARRNTQKHKGYQRLGMTHFDTICTFNPLFSSTTCVFNVLEIMWWGASRNADRKSANTRQQKLQLAIQRSIVAKLLHFSTDWLWMRVNSQILSWGHLSYNFFWWTLMQLRFSMMNCKLQLNVTSKSENDDIIMVFDI